MNMDDQILNNLEPRFHKYYKWVEDNKRKLLTEEELDKHQYDWVRLAVSIGLLDLYYGNKPKMVLELGGTGVATKLVKKFFKSWSIEGYSNDLRQKGWSVPANFYDLVLNMEVIEHLTDVHEKDFEWNATFKYTGALNCLKESKRVIRKNGRIFLSTPNICCYLSLLNMINGEIPRQYPPHVREYNYKEILNVIKRAKLKVVDFECIETLCVKWDFSKLKALIKEQEGDSKNRGSNFFFNIAK